jgi:starch phosphorylase
MIDCAWSGVTLGPLDVHGERDGYHFAVRVELGSLDPCLVRVELYANPSATEAATHVLMTRVDGVDERRGAVYEVSIATTRPSSHFTPRVVPFHPEACVPAESARIRWQR